MPTDRILVRITYLKNGVPDENASGSVEEKTQELINQYADLIYSKLEGAYCRFHPNSLKQILIDFDIDTKEMDVMVRVCCKEFSMFVETYFSDYPIPITVAFLKPLDQSEQN
jgi:hypothetical protein